MAVRVITCGMMDYRRITGMVCLLTSLIAFYALYPSQSMAAPKAPVFPGIGYQADLTVSAIDGSNDNLLTWTPYSGDFSVFGYDVYYGTSPTAPGQNDGRIETGASDGNWRDVDARGASRCEPSNYFVVAYSRGRKQYSDPAQGTGPNLCGSADDIAPVVTIGQPVSGQSYQGTPLFTGTATDEGGSGIDSITVQISNNVSGLSEQYFPTVNNDEWVVVTELTEGSYTVTAVASDVSGNVSSPVNVDFIVAAPVDDTTSPVLNITSPEEGQVFLSSRQQLSGTADDFGGSGVLAVELEITGTQTLSATVPTLGNAWSFDADLPDGEYAVTVDAFDQAGNPADTVSRSFSVARNVVIGEDGYNDIQSCDITSFENRVVRAPDRPPTFQDTFDPGVDIHDQLQQNWKSSYEWRTDTSDVIINNESQFYLDVLDRDASFRDTWSPFELLSEGGNGFLSINAAKASVLNGGGPIINGAANAGQEYLSGVLTTFGIHSLSPNNAADGKVVVEVRAKMPRGQGAFPAAWLYNESFFRNNSEIDIYEYIGQSPYPDGSGYMRPSSPECGAPCVNAERLNYDTYATQYHNFYISSRGKLAGLGATSVDDKGDPTGAVYTSSSSSTWWRGNTWGGCLIDFSEKFHKYTMEWSSEALVFYIDDVEVLRLDESADSGGNLPRVDFVPIDTRPMYLTINFALGSADSYIGAPDSYTRESMDNEEFRYIIDYIKVWQ